MGESNLVCIDLGTDSFKESGVYMSHEVTNDSFAHTFFDLYFEI